MPANFQTTRWSIVARSTHEDVAIARQAIGELCATYWFPLYAYMRRSGHTHDDSMDLVQSFCGQLIERGGVASADRRVGRFRQYLLGAMRHFASNAQRRERTKKRWGGSTAWNWEAAAERFAADASEDDSPERQYERRWALALLGRAQDRLRGEYSSPSRQPVLTALEPLLHESTSTPLVDIAESLGTTEGALRVALHRMRRRLRDLLRDEVAQTLADPADIDEEIRALQAALGR